MFCNLEMIGGRDSTVSIVTAYELNGPGIEFQWGQDFLHMSRPAWGCPPSLLYNGNQVFPRGKVAGVWRPPTPI